MKRKAVFLDRDGTINVDKDYLYRIEDFEFIQGVIDALKIFQEKDYLPVIVTNQSGIARGYYSEEDLIKLNTWLTKRLEREDIFLGGIYYCPHLPDAPVKRYNCICDCRKPKTGLFYRAAQELDIDLNNSIVIGDRERDIELSKEINGCRGYLVGNSCCLLQVAKNI